MTAAEHVSDFNLTTDTPHLALTGELWGVYCEDFVENWPCYIGTALYFINLSSLNFFREMIEICLMSPKNKFSMIRVNQFSMGDGRDPSWSKFYLVCPESFWDIVSPEGSRAGLGPLLVCW